MYYKILLLLIVVCYTTSLLSQSPINNPLKIPTIVSSYPEAKELGKYGDIPVSTYTGVPDISIPLHTVKIGSLTLPITLSYHSSGVEVSQEASWVGLGWNLIAGGSISYIPIGGDDNSSSSFKLNQSEFAIVRNYVGNYFKNEDWYADWQCVPIKDPFKDDYPVITTPVIRSILSGTNEQDVWSANFLNYSFKFAKHPITGAFFVIGQNNKCKITGYNGFEIMGEDGTTYYFNKNETYSTYTSSWYLTKIVSAKGDVIELRYIKAYADGLPGFSEMVSVQNYTRNSGQLGGIVNPSRRVSPDKGSSNLYLSEIETKNELVTFESEPTRDDLKNGHKLLKIVVKDKLTNISKLSYKFVYSYFKGDCIWSDYLNDGTVVNNAYSKDNKEKRLKLDELIQCNDNLPNNSYVFTYNDQALPAKTSFSIDYWGYYNGQGNVSSVILGANHTLIPNVLPLIVASPMPIAVAPEFFTLNGAVRGASKNYITAGMLKSIQYPTKGRTEFEFEPHEFDNYKVLSAEEETSSSLIINGNVAVIGYSCLNYRNNSVYERTFTLKHKVVVRFIGFINHDQGSFAIEGVDVPTGFTTINYRFTGDNSALHVQEWDEKIMLNPGVYKLICMVRSTSDSCSNYDQMEASGNITFKDYDENLISSGASIGGGVRVKSIVNYDENNKLVSSKRFSYNYASGETSGRLMLPLKYLDYRNIEIADAQWIEPSEVVRDGYWQYRSDYAELYTLEAQNAISISGNSCANKVGYDRVEVESFSGNTTNGKEISYFENTPGYLYFNKVAMFYPGNNGNLLKKIVLKNNGDTVLTEKYNYGILPGTQISENINLFAEDTYQGPTGVCVDLGNPLAYLNRFNIFAYPTYQYYNALLCKETTQYFTGGKVKATTSYTYNNENLGVKTVTSSTSETDKYKITEYTYPFNYSEAPYTNMVQRNILTPVIEQTDKLNTTFLQSVKTNYKDWFNDQKIIAPETVEARKGSSLAETRVRYKYNTLGNLLEASKEGDVITSYIWGYNENFPVVKIEGKAEVDISQSIKDAISNYKFSGKSDYTNINVDMNWLKTQLASLLADNTCVVTFYTYDPIFGMTSQTDPNGQTTYYEYDVLGRLKAVRDNDRNILKSYEYNYKK